MARKMRQIAVALDDHMRAQIEALAKARGTGVAEEVRAWIERGLRDERLFDQPTQQLGEYVKELARDVSFSKTIGWHNNSMVHQALREAISGFLDGLRPRDDDAAFNRTLQKEYDASAIGKTVAHLLLRRREDAEVQERPHPATDVIGRPEGALVLRSLGSSGGVVKERQDKPRRTKPKS